MALTPDDIASAQFQQVRFRPGYNVDQVDDFLDEIEKQWRKDLARIAELERQIAALRRG
ncbi:DivIVA domain-containing protein [Saccharopolyspora indica]|uniref:DivIVA domain-containing protein n=1 Tax=Saccharopolyspora indica TaxID=1229659 RepID=UPI0022EB983B|nr:DivIVA domain-containing protein [Saccharopolyspora indica]MDA3646127.1 DivIVA domain-containing protein [Saccharopolyspora indica]